MDDQDDWRIVSAWEATHDTNINDHSTQTRIEILLNYIGCYTFNTQSGSVEGKAKEQQIITIGKLSKDVQGGTRYFIPKDKLFTLLCSL